MTSFDLQATGAVSYQDALFNPQEPIHEESGSRDDWQPLLSSSPSLPLTSAPPTSTQQASEVLDMALTAVPTADAGDWNDSPPYTNTYQFAVPDALPTDGRTAAFAQINDKRKSGSSFATALRCPHPSCSSKLLFTRRCDMDKHYRLHFRKYFCRTVGCHMSYEAAGNEPRIGFATIKDRNRHENSHSPSLPCPICGQLFSRYDNMRDHCQRRHLG